jgi:hypothetical protein
LVYLRAADRVLSCPRIDLGAPLAVQPQTALGQIMCVADRDRRTLELEQLCDKVLADASSVEARSFIRQLIDLALSLDGLPPSTFDVLQLLAERPQLGPLMLFQASTEELEPVIRLAEGLPFAWWLISDEAWHAAQNSQADYLFGHFPDDVAPVAQWISQRRAGIAALDPILDPFLDQPGSRISLDEAANAFLNRSGDRLDSSVANPFRPRLADQLPNWRFGENFWRALDAPVVAALAARNQLNLSPPELACAKDIARRHPRWFREAFAAVSREY